MDLDGIESLLKRHENPGGTHYENCYLEHPLCAASVMLDELRRTQRGLRAIADSPGGGPGRRIAMQLLSANEVVGEV